MIDNIYRDKLNKVRETKNEDVNYKATNVFSDVKDEFEALGNDNYETNKGFSSDMYIKIKTQEEITANKNQ